MTTSKFELNKTYTMRFIGDSDLLVKFVCIARTATMVTLKGERETIKRKIKLYNGIEYVVTENYSMAPAIYSNK